MSKISVAELFAGVGGFRLGFQKCDKNAFDFIFANQWEPNKKIQHAFNCYVNNFGSENAFNNDISIDKVNIPNNFDLLVGGFPCQDYSVASTNAKGIEGKKGVLWWEISWILEHKKPKMVLLENVDRLLLSPSSSRGRDFAIMLFNFNKLGYNVEWQVINAADYGFVQRRRRVFIFATLREKFVNLYNGDDTLLKNSFFDDVFPVSQKEGKNESKSFDLCKIYKNEVDITDNYENGKFEKRGFLVNGSVYMFDSVAINNYGKSKLLKDILEKHFDEKYLLNNEQINKMKTLKGSKKILRTKPNGETYYYSEGSMSLFDSINKPGRTMLTSESSLNRSTHIIKLNENDNSDNKYRFLTPIEAERLNGFPDNWTSCISSEKMRYFCMGNALVVDLIEIMARRIIEILK